MSKEFDPNTESSWQDGIYGLPFTKEEALVHFIPVPWDATTSYQTGTSAGPQAMLEASEQIDFFNFDYGEFFKNGLHLLPTHKDIPYLNKTARPFVEELIEHGPNQEVIDKVNGFSDQINEIVYQQAKHSIEAGKIAAVLGGDHSSPYGLIKALSEKHSFGILHIDAHFDLRQAYLGCEHSHASIMYNVMTKLDNIERLVSIGIRDFCEAEYKFYKGHQDIYCHFDKDLKNRHFEGATWKDTCDEIISKLPVNVYISFDIDGLDPQYCPNTGTPVPGGISYSEIEFLLKELSQKRKIIGFDLVEVAPGEESEWDANVGMRMLYLLSGATIQSQTNKSEP